MHLNCIVLTAHEVLKLYKLVCSDQANNNRPADHLYYLEDSETPIVHLNVVNSQVANSTGIPLS